MKNNTENLAIPDELIMNKILFIRGINVMIDSDLAELFDVSTKRLNEQVKRNTKRFPEDFMFQLTENEKEKVVAKCDHLSKIKYSRFLPYAFTEHGTVMLASILNSERAINVNIRIVRIFNKMREMLIINKDTALEVERINRQLSDHEEKIVLVFEYLKQFERAKEEERKFKNRPQVGFKTSKEFLDNIIYNEQYNYRGRSNY